MSAQPTSVLFICTTNAVRSVMAEAMLKHLHGRRLRIESAGIRAGPPDPFAAAVMEEMGLDLSGHHPRTIEELGDNSFDLLITLSPEAQHRAMEMTRDWSCEVEFWNTLDVTAVWGAREQRLDAYRQVRDGLMRRITERFPLGLAPQV